MASKENLQDRFLSVLRDKEIPVSIFLKNGIKLQGKIGSFDRYSVMLKNVTTQVVYKHAISTVTPAVMDRGFTRRQSERKE